MKKLAMTTCFVVLSSLCFSQLIAVVDYMKVPASGPETYLSIEKQWKAFHQRRVAEGKLLAWELFYVHNSGTDSKYNYITVSIYDSEAKAVSGFTGDELRKFFGDKTADLLKKTFASRSLAYSETFRMQLEIPSVAPDKYVRINYIKILQPERYFTLEKDGYMPVHKLAVEQGKLNGWSVWSLTLKDDESYDVVTVDSFASANQLEGLKYGELISSAKNKMDVSELYNIFKLFDETEDIRRAVKVQLWELIDATTPGQANQ